MSGVDYIEAYEQDSLKLIYDEYNSTSRADEVGTKERYIPMWFPIERNGFTTGLRYAPYPVWADDPSDYPGEYHNTERLFWVEAFTNASNKQLYSGYELTTDGKATKLWENTTLYDDTPFRGHLGDSHDVYMLEGGNANIDSLTSFIRLDFADDGTETQVTRQALIDAIDHRVTVVDKSVFRAVGLDENGWYGTVVVSASPATPIVYHFSPDPAYPTHDYFREVGSSVVFFRIAPDGTITSVLKLADLTERRRYTNEFGAGPINLPDITTPQDANLLDEFGFPTTVGYQAMVDRLLVTNFDSDQAWTYSPDTGNVIDGPVDWSAYSQFTVVSETGIDTVLLNRDAFRVYDTSLTDVTPAWYVPPDFGLGVDPLYWVGEAPGSGVTDRLWLSGVRRGGINFIVLKDTSGTIEIPTGQQITEIIPYSKNLWIRNGTENDTERWTSSEDGDVYENKCSVFTVLNVNLMAHALRIWAHPLGAGQGVEGFELTSTGKSFYFRHPQFQT